MDRFLAGTPDAEQLLDLGRLGPLSHVCYGSIIGRVNTGFGTEQVHNDEKEGWLWLFRGSIPCLGRHYRRAARTQEVKEEYAQ